MERHPRKLFACCLLIIKLLPCSGAVVSFTSNSIPVDSGEGAFIVVISLLVLVLGGVLLLFLCGGCTGMEVSSESHPASAGKKGQGQYDSVATDVNTHVLNSGTTMPTDSHYQPSGEQTMPYGLNPTLPTAPAFSGYHSVPPQNSSQGWGSGYGQQGGYGQGSGGGFGQGGGPGPNAHRSPFDNEPPPPSYSSTIVNGSDFVPYQ